MMLTFLSLLGGGSAIGAALFFIPELGPALIRFATAIPKQVWLGLAALAVLGGAVWWVSHKIEAARAEGYARGGTDREAQWSQAFNDSLRKAAIYKAGFLAVSEREARELRSKTDETLRRNAAVADDLRLRGPGAAAAPVCRSGDGADNRTRADRPGAPSRSGDAPVAPVPDREQLAIVPWLELTRFAEQHDRYRAERNALIEHIDTQNRRFDELRANLAAALPKFGGEQP